MSAYLHSSVSNGTGVITLDRPQALNSLSLDMVRALTRILRAWRADAAVAAVLIRSSAAKAFCAGGDIRFFHEVGRGPRAALLEDFFTEEYALNHLIHHYPKPYIALMDGVVMGGGMGISQAGPQARVRIVTERTRMAMPEVNIGLFPDVGGSHFLSRAPDWTGYYLGLTGLTIHATDALYAGLADLYLPSAHADALAQRIAATPGSALRESVTALAAPFRAQLAPGVLEAERGAIGRHFSAGSVPAIMDSLAADDTPFAREALYAMRARSPLMMCVTHELLRRGAGLGLADCLRMERELVRRCFEHGEVLEGVRALVISKDNAPRWNPPALAQVDAALVAGLFEPVWPAYAHPLRGLD